MADVGVRVTVDGAEEAQQKLQGVADAIEKTGDAAGKTTGPLGNVGEQFKKLAPDVDEAGGALSKLADLAPIVGAALGTAAVAGVAYFATQMVNAVRDTIELGDQLNVLSQRTGVAVEMLSGGLRLAAETSGSSIQGLAQGLKNLNISIAEAADGSGKAARVFEQLRISVYDSNGALKSADQILYELSSKFAATEDGANKVAIAQTLMKQAGVELIPTMNQGIDGLERLEKVAKLAGATMSTETAEAASKLNENFKVLDTFAKGFWQGVASPIISGLEKITTAMVNARIAGEGWWGSLQEAFKKAFELAVLPDARKKLEDVQKEMSYLSSQLPITGVEVGRSVGGLIGGAIGIPETGADVGGMFGGKIASTLTTPEAMQARMKQLIEEEKKLQELVKIEKLWETTGAGAYLTGTTKGDLPPPPPGTTKPPAAKTEKTPDELALSQINAELQYAHQLLGAGELGKEQYLTWLDEMLAGWGMFEKARVKISAERFKAWSELLLAEEKLQDQTDAETLKKIQANKKLEIAALKEVQKEIAYGAELTLKEIDNTTFMFKYQKISVLEDLRDAYANMGKEGEEGLKKVNEKIRQVTASQKEAGVVIQDVSFSMINVWKTAEHALASTISETTKWLLGLDSKIHSLGDALKGFVRSVVDEIISQFARAAANDVIKWFFNLLNPGSSPGAGTGSTLSFLSSLGGSALKLLGGGSAPAAGSGGAMDMGVGLGGVDDSASGGGILGALGSAGGALAKIFGIGGSSSAAAAGTSAASTTAGAAVNASSVATAAGSSAGVSDGGGGGILGALGAAGAGLKSLLGFGSTATAGAAAGATAAGSAGVAAGGAMDMGVGLEGLFNYTSPAIGAGISPSLAQFAGSSMTDFSMSAAANAGDLAALGTGGVGAAAGGGGFFDSISSFGGDLFGGIQSLFSGGGGGLLGGGGGLLSLPGKVFDPILSGVGGMFQDLGVSMGSQAIADIGNSLAGGLGGIGGSVMPIVGGLFQALTGDVAGGAGSAIGGIIGSAFGPLGSLAGSFLGSTIGGLLGGGEQPGWAGFDLDGQLGPDGFQGNVTVLYTDGSTFVAPSYAEHLSQLFSKMWQEKLPGATLTVPIKTKVAPSEEELGYFTTTPTQEELSRADAPQSVDDGWEWWINPKNPYSTLGNAENLLSGVIDQLATQRFVNGIQQFATGGDAIFSSPTMISVGEVGPERVTVSPLAGAAHNRGGGGPNVSINVQGMSLMDSYSAKRMFYELQRVQMGA